LTLTAGLSPDLSDGVAQETVTLAPTGPLEYIETLSVTTVDDGAGERPLGYDERVYWRMSLSLGGPESATYTFPRTHSFETPPAPGGAPQTFRFGFISCHTSSGDGQPLLSYRLFRERGCRFVLRLGDNGYNDSQIFDRYSNVTGPWAAQELDDLFTALLPTYLDPELSVAARTIPMWDQGDDHDYVTNNWHAGFADASRWQLADRPVNSERQRVDFPGGPPAFREQLVGQQSNRTAWFLGLAPGNNSVLGFQDLTALGFTVGESVRDESGAIVGTVLGNDVPHGWRSPGAALFYVTSEQLFSRGVTMWNRWQGGGFQKLGGVESGRFADAESALADGHYYRSFETAKTLFILLDNRRFQEPVAADGEEDSEREFLGFEQLIWLEEKLQDTTKPFVVIGSTGVVGDVHSDDDNWFAFQSWRDELYRIGAAADQNKNIKRVLYVVGDRHSTFAHTSRRQGAGDVNSGFWTLGTHKGVEFDAGPAAMSALRDDATNPGNTQYRFDQVPRGDVQGRTSGWVDLIPENAAPLDPKYIVDGDPDEIVHFSTLLAKDTELQGQSPPKRAYMAGTVEIDEINETFTLRAWDVEADLETPVVGLVDENDPDPYGSGRLLWSRTFPFDRGVAACPADLTGDRNVDSADLGQLLSAWDSGGADLDGDGVTGSADLGILLAAWGPCP